MSKPVMYDKKKWDTSTGLDYGGASPLVFTEKYVHHDFPPLFKNTKLVSQCDLEGKGDAVQLVKVGHYIYICHAYSGGFSVVDVKDPADPQVVNFIPTDSPHVWSIKCRALGNILVVANDWKFFEPVKYHVHPEYPNWHMRGPKEPIQSGIKVYDITKPAEPKLLSFFKTGEWSPDGGGNYCHRFWFDGHYAYIAAEMPGFFGGISVNVDLSDPKNPKEVSRFWRTGQHVAAGETPWWPIDMFPGTQMHHPIVQGDRMYAAWFALGGTIIDISNIRLPRLVSEFNFNFGGQNHTFLPLKNRQFAMFISEYTHSYMLDISDEKHPKVIATFPRPPKELKDRGVTPPWGPGLHNVHENPPGPDSFKSDDKLYVTAQCGGLRIFDVSDPYRPTETGYYVPGTPKVYYSPYGLGGHSSGVDMQDVFVDNKGLIYVSLSNGGLEILESKS
ncbi:MAG TPA: hypothetical protein VLY21_00305 [Nitrososphaerales archaeon]|nr:hypothetical protein [Nitrososphaerales archaeon]